MLDVALGSGVKVPLTDVGEACDSTGAGGVASCVAAEATPEHLVPLGHKEGNERGREGNWTGHRGGRLSCWGVVCAGRS